MASLKFLEPIDSSSESSSSLSSSHSDLRATGTDQTDHNVAPKVEKCTQLLENIAVSEDLNEKLVVFYKDMNKKSLDYESHVKILFANNPIDFVVNI